MKVVMITKLVKSFSFMAMTLFVLTANVPKEPDTNIANKATDESEVIVETITIAPQEPIIQESNSTTDSSKEVKNESTTSEDAKITPPPAEESPSTIEPVEPVEKTEPIAETEHVNVSNQPVLQPQTLSILGKEIKYENGGMAYGQSIIDNNPNIASTWGGAATQSVNDGQSTHFISHNYGPFNILFQLVLGDIIKVVDNSGNEKNYYVESFIVVNIFAIDANTGEDRWDMITSAGNGESIALQTCIDDQFNLIVIAK